MIGPVLIFATGQTEEARPTAAVDGTVEYFDGEVTINNESVDFGMKVPFGAVVTTGPESYCEIVFDKKNIFRIQESTVAEIQLSPSNPEIILKKGAFAALFNKLENMTKENPFKVRTQSAIAAVRGTAFFVKVIDDNNTYICICNGELDVTVPEAADAASLSSGHHKAVYFRNVDGVSTTEKAPLLYHNDDGMEALADHIEEAINWYY
jgi:hypothetical protein